MAQLEFQEIAQLINHSQTTKIDTQPFLKADGWSMYRATHNVHTSVYDFKILYLHAGATIEQLGVAARHLDDEEKTHVVYPPSLLQKHSLTIKPEKDKNSPFRKAKGRWTTKEYLVSFIENEIRKYREKIQVNAPKYYIDPRVETPSGFPRRIPNPVLSFLRSTGSESGIKGGALGILLAEPGQGKTYMSRHLVSTMSGVTVPLLVDSSQWHSMSVDDQTSLTKTIAHSFRHFEATISWLDGHEDQFLQSTLKGDVFRIVFDGFDEYILRNKGLVHTMEVLEALATLARTNETRIVITSRTAFWNTNLPEAEVKSFVEKTGSLVFTILPFDLEYAKNYFKQRLKGEKAVGRAVQLYSALQKANRDFVGRGFVLSLIADLVEKGDWSGAFDPASGNALLWLMEALCEREVLRHKLPFSAQEQIDVMRTFAIEVAKGAPPNSEFLELSMHDVRPQLDESSRQDTLEKFKIHPLLRWEESKDQWQFEQEQIGIVLLADQIVRWASREISSFMNKANLDAGSRQDLGTAVVDLARMQSSTDGEALSRLEEIVNAMSSVGDVLEGTLVRIGDGPRLAAVISLIAVERFLPRGSSHQERTQLLRRISGTSAIMGLSFTGTIARYDFREVNFERCRFERVTWANCKFDDSTKFSHCQFIGGSPPLHCEGFGSVHVDMATCRLDVQADAVLNSARVKEGRKQYSIEDLRADISLVIGKFIIKGGVGLKTVDAIHLSKGAISGSRYKNEILEVLDNALFEQHHISGAPEGGYNIREEAKEAVKFYATNNVFTGALREAFERLRKKLLAD